MTRKQITWIASVALALGAVTTNAQMTNEGMRSGQSGSRPGFTTLPPIQQSHDEPASASAQRQEKIRRDTDRIAELSVELKKAVDAAGPGQLSLDVIRKAAEIERLSKEVRDLMKAQ